MFCVATLLYKIVGTHAIFIAINVEFQGLTENYIPAKFRLVFSIYTTNSSGGVFMKRQYLRRTIMLGFAFGFAACSHICLGYDSSVAYPGIPDASAMGTIAATSELDANTAYDQINTLNNQPNPVSFSDVPKNHWAYKAVTNLAGNGVVNGYPDRTFLGNRTTKRYESASMMYRAMQRRLAINNNLLKALQPGYDRIRVDAVSKDPKIERVRVIPGRN